MALIKGSDTPGLNVKPILPDKHYIEGRISSGDRIVFRVEGSTIYFMDVVKHDASGAMAGDRDRLVSRLAKGIRP